MSDASDAGPLVLPELGGEPEALPAGLAGQPGLLVATVAGEKVALAALEGGEGPGAAGTGEGATGDWSD